MCCQMQQPRRLCSVVQGTVNRGYRLLPPVRVAQHVDHAAACVDDVLATHMPFTFLHYMYAQAVPVLHQQRSPHSLPGVAQQALASSAVTHWDHSFAASCASWLMHHGSDKGAAIWLVTAAACSCCILLYRLPLLCTACDKPLEGQEVQEQGAHEQVRGHKL